MAKYFSSEVTKDILIRKKVLTLTNIPAIKLREREREPRVGKNKTFVSAIIIYFEDHEVDSILLLAREMHINDVKSSARLTETLS